MFSGNQALGMYKVGYQCGFEARGIDSILDGKINWLASYML